ncbi:MAG: DUF4149 domain-containing protein [Pseudomonadota bacterium]
MIESVALLSIALLFGGMTLYSFAFAAFLFTSLPPEDAGPLLRKAFPHFYAWVVVTSLIAGALSWETDSVTAVILIAIAVTTIPTRQVLMPAINRAQDAGDKGLFNTLHGASVVITLGHIAAAAYALIRLAS